MMRWHSLAVLALVVACGDGSATVETATDDALVPSSTGSAAAGVDESSADEVGSPTTDSTTTDPAATSSSTLTDASSGSDDAPVDPQPDAGPATPSCDPLEPCTAPTEDGTCRLELELEGGMRLHYWSTLSLVPAADAGGCHAAIERAVIVVHGTSRNPWSYMQDIVDAATLAGADASTLVIAPWFPSDDDDPDDGTHVWDPGSSGWKDGNDSLTDPPTSSFAVIDRIVLEGLLDAGVFPALAEIVITGHSAGAQFVQRYAVATDVDETATTPLRFVVMNPSSYVYLDAWRWNGEGAPPGVELTIPAGTDCDDDYDDYKYGLADVPDGHYVAQHAASIPSAALARDIVVLLGEDDDEVDDDLDTSCPATLQGEHRLERGLVYIDHLDTRFPEHAHTVATVPGVGHDHTAMYASPAALAALFGD